MFIQKYIFAVLISTTLLSFAQQNNPAQAKKKYFQQDVNYIIHATLDDATCTLKASETIEYTNNSPDELTFIYMHLWPNGYKNNSTALAKQLLENGKTSMYYADKDELGYIDSLDFFIDGKKVKWEYDKEHIDICKITLNEPLKSGNKIIIETPFKVKIPKSGLSRLGGEKGGAFQITQWYPKPAVYDINGWHPMPYLDQGEFYSEYGTFDVYITLPKNYVVAATGDLQNEDELAWLEQKSKETQAKKFEAAKSYKIIVPNSDILLKTLHYSQKNIHDFAWFADKNFYVTNSEVELPYSKRKVKTWAMFKEVDAHLWKDATNYINDGIYHYSLWIGEYPYNQATAVYGGLGAGGGMEYPNVTVIGPTSNKIQLETVIVHEIGHNWFYGLLGSNERVHAWMDEGINSYYENRYFETKYPKSLLIEDLGVPESLAKKFDLNRYQRKYQYYLMYTLQAAINKDQAISVHSKDFTDFNYGGIVYAKGAIVFDYLCAFLGKKTFDEAMRTYYEEWHYKHPQPEDLKKILEDVSGKNLDWFFNDIIGSTKKIDYKIKSAKRLPDGSYDLVIKNKTNTLSPVSIHGIKENKVMAMVWYDGFPGKQYVGFPPMDIDYFKIDYTEDIPETNRNNNTIRSKGIFKKTEPLKLQFLGSFDNPDKAQLFYTPITGFNNYNKALLGMAFYNSILPRKKVEFLFAPMYGTGNKQLAGHANITFNMYPKGKLFQAISLSTSANRYGYSAFPFDLNYIKITPELHIKFKKKRERSSLNQSLNLRHINISKQTFKGRYDLTQPVYTKDSSFTFFNEVTYQLENKSVINPYDLSLTYQQGDEMSKLFLNVNYKISFKQKGKSIDLRFFAGTFIDKRKAQPYLFRMSGQRGNQDYLFDNYYMGRTDYNNFLSQQFTETDGGLKVYTPLGQTNNSILSLNIKSSLPFKKIPIRIFADIGAVPKEGSILVKQTVFYDAGLMITFMKNIAEVYFPLVMSGDMQKNLELNQVSYAERIRFTLNLNKLHPIKNIKNLSL